MEQSFSRIVSDFNESFCTCLFSPKTKSFMLNSLIFYFRCLGNRIQSFWPKSAPKSLKIDKNCTVATSRISTFWTCDNLYSTVLLYVNLRRVLELNLVFLSCSNCVGKVGGVTRYWNLSFFDIFELILLQAAVTRKSVHALERQS